MSRYRLFGVLIEVEPDGYWRPAAETEWGRALASGYLACCLRLSMLLAGREAVLRLDEVPQESRDTKKL